MQCPKKCFFQQLNSFSESGLRPHHSTETAPVKVINTIQLNMTNGNNSVLVLLDFSATFDIVIHNILLCSLEKTG